MALATTVRGIRRKADHPTKVEVLVSGGWMKWTFLDASTQAAVRGLPQVQEFADSSADDGWRPDKFNLVWADQDTGDPDDESFDGETSEGGDPELEALLNEEAQIESQNQGKPAQTGKPTFEMPDTSGGGEGDSEGNGGDDSTFVTFAEKDPKGRPLKSTTQLVPFDEAYTPRAQALGQAVMEQTVEFVRKDIKAAVDAVTADTAELMATSEKYMLSQAVEYTDTKVAEVRSYVDSRLESFTPKQSEAPQDTSLKQVIVKIEVKRPNVDASVIQDLAHKEMPSLLKLVASGQHVYLPGVPGGGKSHAAQQVAKALGWAFGSLSLGPNTPESRLWGGMDANGKFHTTSLIDSVIHAEKHEESGAVWVADEMDNGHPGILATINSLLANGWVTLPDGTTHTVGGNFVVIGCANTFGTGPTAEFSGRNRLDAATLDRFSYLPWETDTGLETALVEGILAGNDPENGWLKSKDWLQAWRQARANVDTHGLKVFVTMRGAINGAKMIAGGWSLDDALDIVLLNKMPSDQKKKVDPR